MKNNDCIRKIVDAKSLALNPYKHGLCYVLLSLASMGTIYFLKIVFGCTNLSS